MDKAENLEYWLEKFYLNLSITSQDIDMSEYHFCPLIKASNSAEN